MNKALTHCQRVLITVVVYSVNVTVFLFAACTTKFITSGREQHLMNSKFLLIALSMVAISGLVTISFTSTTNAVSHVDGSSMTEGANSTMTGQEQEHNETSTVVRDSLFVDLSGKSIPGQDFIHLYDTTPYMIMNGHVAAKLPCDDQAVSAIQILIGQAPNMTSAELELVSELSSPGENCLYHADLHSAHGNHTGTAEGMFLTDIAIMNPTNSTITFSDTSTVVIGVNEIMPLPDDAHGHEAEEEEHDEETG
jgi:hypothetical protein